MLLRLGLRRGDRIAVYMPMIPELAVTMLACTRIGVAHSVIFGGVLARCHHRPLRGCRGPAGGSPPMPATAGGAPAALKPNVDLALAAGAPSVEHVVVVDRCGTDPAMVAGRDLWWHDLMADAAPDCPAEPMDSEQLLYLLYTSGTTAKPKGIMHTTGGYLTQVAFTHRYVFDLRPDSDVFWCAADIGWVTGHSYIVYGPLANGATSVMYEGTPDTPRPAERSGDRAGWAKDRLWDIVERYGVTQLYTAPTAIRTFMKWGEQWPAGRDLSSLRVLGTVGEPINPEAWDVVPPPHRHGALPDRGHLVADRDRRPHDHPAAGGDHHQAGGRPPSRCRACSPRWSTIAGNVVSEGGGYLTITRPWAVDAAGHLGRPGALPRDLLVCL